MISKFTFIKRSILALFLCGALNASAEIYPVYLTQGGSVKLGLGTALNAGETAVWSENGSPLTSASDGSYTIPAGQTVGIHTYKVHLVSPNPALCSGDVTEYKVYVLPATTVALAEGTTKLYCENVDGSSAFVATATPASALPEGISYVYTWEGTTGSTTQDPNSGWGSSVVSSDTRSSTFTFNSKVVGTYNLIVKAAYVVPEESVLKTESDILSKMTSGSQSVEVSPMPSKPTIVVM